MKDKKPQGLLIGIVTGAVLGLFCGTFFPVLSVKTGFVGDIFLNALKMMILPLIVTSMIVGITNLGDIRHLGNIGVKTLLYYVVTTGMAVAIGIILVLVIQPGTGFEHLSAELPLRLRSRENFSFVDVITGLVHPNLFQAASEMKILPVIIASIIFGMAFTTLGERGKILIDFFQALNDAVMKIVHIIIYFAPFGIFSLIAYRIGSAGGGAAVFALISSLGKYCFTVIAGLLIHGVIVLPLVLVFFARRNAWIYFVKISKALMTAFGTASSSATLPLTYDCVTDDANVDPRVASFVLPLGATINMDGTALYEAVAAIFIAQYYGIHLGGGAVVVVFLTATLAAIGAAGIPEAGLVTMVIVLQSVGLPVEGIGLILAVDWFLDRCRTTVNVWGDAIGAAVVDKIEHKTKRDIHLEDKGK